MKITKVTIPNTNYTKGREGNTIDKIVLHWVVGSLATCDATFKNKDRKASAHYCIEDTTIHQYVDEADTAWHAGNWNCNTQSIGIEHSGGDLLSDGKTRRKPSEETHKTSAWLVGEISKKYNIPLDRKHILKHSEVSDKSTACPGTLDIDYIIKLAKENGSQTMKPTEKLPEAFYNIKEAKELIKRKLITAKDAFDTILSKFVATSDVLEKQKVHFDEETNALIDEKEVLQDKLEGVTQDLNARNSYITELEAKVDRLNSIISNQPTSAKGEVNSKDIVKWLKNTGWYAILPLVITYLTVLQTNIPKEYAVIAVPLIATGIDFIKKLISDNEN